MYLASVIDLGSRRVVGWAMADDRRPTRKRRHRAAGELSVAAYR
jgi:transposase InsO family protein